METPQDEPPRQNTPPPVQGYGHPVQQPYYQPVQYPEQSQSTTVLVLGILGLILCQVLAPIAWSMGTKELAAIDSGRRSPLNREHANIGRILGIIGTILLGLAVVAFAAWFLFVGAIILGGVSSAAVGM